MMQQTHNAKLSAVLVNGTWRWKSQIRRFNKNKKQMLFVPPWEFDKITWLFSKNGTYTSMKHRYFKTLSVFVSDTMGTLLHACPHCIEREKKYLLI